MNREELARLVARMRTAQKTYFRFRDAVALQESRDLERRVDTLCDEILNPQPGLFDQEEPRHA